MSKKEFNDEVCNYSQDEEIKKFIENNRDDDGLYLTCYALAKTVIDIKIPNSFNIMDKEQYKDENLSFLKEKFEEILEKLNISRTRLFDFITIWYTRALTEELFKRQIQPEFNRLLTKKDNEDWNYIKKILGIL